MLSKNLSKKSIEHLRLYMKLDQFMIMIKNRVFYWIHAGESFIMISKDMNQAVKMLNMRIKIDVWTQRLDESFRKKIRENLRELFCQLSTRRVWYCLKQIKNMLLNDKATIESQLNSKHMMNKPKNIIVNDKYFFFIINSTLLFCF